MKYKEQLQNLLKTAGLREGRDYLVKNEKLYARVFSSGSLGLGEAYMDGWWDAPRLDDFFDKLLSSGIDKTAKKNPSLIMAVLWSKILNPQSKRRAFKIAKAHYDIGNDLFERMLDKRLTYTCGYWKDGKTLDEAQEAKLDLICQKLKLKSGMKVLDIGSGWGSFLNYASKKYGVKAVGVTVSKEQVELAKKMSKGLDVETKLADYRNISGKYDRVVSVGMIEHVGSKNYKTFMKTVDRVLKDDGIFLLHTIGKNTSTPYIDPWIAKYIFPNSSLPSIKQLAKAMEGLFVMEDWHNFGVYYDKTLMAWYENFKNSWNEIKDNYDERFYRMWEYYLLSCAGSFRSRRNQLWQIVLTKNGLRGGYQSIR